MGSKKKGTIGYKYFLGMHMVLCHGPIDSITKVICGDKTAWSGSNPGTSIDISAENLFGGTKREGGISGTVDFDFGEGSQTQNSYLTSQLGSNISAYRGVVSVVLRQCYVGMSAYLKLWKFRATRINTQTDGSTQWNSTKAAIGQDMNPAHIIRECLTSKTWGMGYRSADIDDVSFSAAASTLSNDGMGISLVWDKQISIEDFIKEIVKHIDGSLYVDRVSGKFVLKLVRDDRDYDSLPVLDESNITKVKDYSKPILGELTTSVTVIYWSLASGQNESVTAQDMALARSQGATIGTTMQYPGFTNGTNAAHAASRDLLALSSPLISCTVHTDRSAYCLNIGDAFRLSWPDYGIIDVVMRVTQIGFGGVNNNEIVITAAQDVFAIAEAVVASPPSSSWVDPVNDPLPSPLRNLVPAPYYAIVRDLGDAYARALEPTDTAFVISAGEPTVDALYASLNVLGAYGYESTGDVDFCPTAILTADIGPNDTVIPISATTRVNIANIGQYVQIGSELARLDYVDVASMTVGRGCLDTVPQPHSANTSIFFSGGFEESDGVLYAIGEVTSVRLTPITGHGELAVDDAPTDTLTHVYRQNLPYCCQNLRLGGLRYPQQLNGFVDLLVEWSHRDRLVQTQDILHDTTFGDIGPEDNTLYTAILRTGGTVLATHSDLSGTSTVFTLSEIDYNESLTIEVYSHRDGVNSYQRHIHTFDYTRSTFDSTDDFTFDDTELITFDIG